jgi:hypothetical protein
LVRWAVRYDYFHHTEPGGEPMLYLNDRPVKREGYMTDLIAEEACGFLRRAAAAVFAGTCHSPRRNSPFQEAPSDAGQPPSDAENMNRGSRAKYVEMGRAAWMTASGRY